MMKINSFMVVFTIISFAWQSTHALDTETFHKNLTRLKAMEKIKHEILRGLGLNNRPIAAPPSQKNLYVLIHNITNPKGRPAEVNEIISFSEAPDNFTDDSIIQFHLAHDTRNKHFTVKSASLLIRVKTKLRHKRRSKHSPPGATLREGGKRKRHRSRGRRISLMVYTVGDDGEPLEKIAAVKSRIKKNKWFKVTLPQTLMQNLVDSSDGTLLLSVKCKGCRKNTQLVMVHSGKRRKRQLKNTRQLKKLKLNSRRPFLILHTMIESRTKRNIAVQCNYRRRNRCCKSTIEVNFRDIGWDDWILSPSSFTTAYCSGVCVGRNAPANETECVPTKRKSLRLLYQGPGAVYTSSVLPNFVVTRCGCQN